MTILVKALLLLAVVLLPATSRAADALPATNKVNWSFSGVPGGIPNRSTVCATLSPGATASSIQSAINNCPDNQVVYLNAGTYSLTSGLKISRSNITLRGAVDASGGPATVLQFSSAASGWGLIDISNAGYPANNWSGNPSRNVVSGFSQGSNTMTLDSTPSGLQVGQIFIIDQLDDENLVRNSTSIEGGGSWSRNGNRSLQQVLRVTGINGSQVSFEPSIYSPYFRASQSPQIYWWGSGTSQVVKLSGIENLKIVRQVGGGGTNNIAMGPADSVWVKNIWSVQAGSSHVRTGFVLNGEIRDSYFTLHDSVASANYAVWVSYSSSMLIENNIMYNVPCALGMMSVAGSVFDYNYGTVFPYSQSNWLPETVMTCHGGHCSHNLFEGNYMPSLWADFYHGNSSYTSMVRNRLTGWESGKTGNTNPMNAHDYQNNFAAIGNVLGTDGYSASYAGDTASIWNYAATSLSSLTRKGNYNYVNKAIPSGESIGSDTIGASYRYSSKPAWFGSLAWPPFDPSNPGAAAPASIPAGYRFQNKANPGAGSAVPAPSNLRVQ